MQTAVREAKTGAIVIRAITPDRPETGYGIFKQPSHQPSAISNQPSAISHQQSAIRKRAANCKLPTLEVIEFTEKPDLEAAKCHLKADNYYWNACMFVLKSSI
jgi:mannose-1-phosphate guanylyltransferase